MIFSLVGIYIKISKRQKRRKLTEHFCNAAEFLELLTTEIRNFHIDNFCCCSVELWKKKKSKEFPFETRKLYMPCKIEKFRTSQKKCLLSTEWNENLFKFHDRNSSEMRMKRMYAKSGFCVEKSWTISRDSLNFPSDYELLIAFASAVSSPLFFVDFRWKLFLFLLFFLLLFDTWNLPSKRVWTKTRRNKAKLITQGGELRIWIEIDQIEISLLFCWNAYEHYRGKWKFSFFSLFPRSHDNEFSTFSFHLWST